MALLAFLSFEAGAQDGIATAARRAAAGKLSPGDRIELHFLRDRELSTSVTVSERGEAVFPKVGTLTVSQLAIGALQDTLVNLYSQFLRAPELEVAVRRRIVVNGEVKAPNVYFLDVASSVRDAIASAGGLLETSNKSKVTIVRDGLRLRVKNWEQSSGPETDLQSGDQIIVGRKNWLVLNALPVISTSVIVIGLIRSLRN
jgi:protein involved in polysaccharide export with SLBB domain